MTEFCINTMSYNAFIIGLVCCILVSGSYLSIQHSYVIHVFFGCVKALSTGVDAHIVYKCMHMHLELDARSLYMYVANRTLHYHCKPLTKEELKIAVLLLALCYCKRRCRRTGNEWWKKVKSVVSVAATAQESAKPYVLLCTRVIRLGVRSCAPMGQSHYWSLKITGVFGWWKPCHRVRSGKRTKRDTAVVIQRQQMSTVGSTRPGCYRFPSLGCHLHHKWWHSLRFAVALVLVLAILTVREWVDVWEGGRCPLSGSGKRRQRKNIDICFFVVRFIATAMLVAAMIADVCIIVRVTLLAVEWRCCCCYRRAPYLAIQEKPTLECLYLFPHEIEAES